MENLTDNQLPVLIQNVNSIRNQLTNELMNRLPFTQEDCDNLSIEELQLEVEKLISFKKGS